LYLFISVAVLLVTLSVLRIEKKKSNAWKMNKNVEVLFIGDSHIEVGIDDKLRNNIVNFSQSGDNYLYTYIKLKNILEHNSNIKTVVLGIDAHNIDSNAIEWYQNYNYLTFKFAKIYPFASLEDITTLFKFNGLDMLRNLPNIVSYKNLKKTNLSEFGEFKKSLDTLVINNIKPCIEIEKPMISNLQFMYLNKIRKSLLEKNIDLILLTMPVHKSKLKCNSKLENEILKYSKFYNLEYINLKNYILEDSDFSDEYHLNSNGAHKITTEILKIVTN
jgi:hypothetical protein